MTPLPASAAQRQRRRLLAALLLLLLLLKVVYHLGPVEYEPDPSLYHDIAAHVRDGDGLVTDVSLFNAGYSYFPHPIALYPLWPLVLGHCARAVPIAWLAVWLPTLCYFATLLLAYRLAVRVVPGPLFPGRAPGVDAGHATVLVLGFTNPMFFTTSQPFTEGLAYLLLTLAMLRTHALCARPGVARGLEVGVWMGLLVLCRSQLVLAPLALAVALGWGALRLGARRHGPAALAFALAFMAVLSVQIWHIASFAAEPRWAYIMRFDLYREPSSLPPLEIMVATAGPLAYVLDRLSGLPVAFGVSSSSYLHTFGGWALALPLALPFALRDCWRAARGRWTAPRQPQQQPHQPHAPAGVFAVFLVVLGAAGLLSLHTIHKAWFNEWNFGTRHALTAALAMLAALLYLARRPGPSRVLALLLLLGGGVGGALRLAYFIHRPPAENPAMVVARVGVVAWLAARAAAEPGLRVAAPDIDAQHLARLGDGVGYHWYYHTFTWEQLQALFDELGVRYLLLRVDAPAPEFQRDRGRFNRGFAPVVKLSSFVVFRRRAPDEPML